MLVRHIPIELSSLMTNFLQAAPENKLMTKVIGKRKREVGLVVPAKYQAVTKTQRIANILYQKLTQKNDNLKNFEMTLKEDEMAIKEERVVMMIINIPSRFSYSSPPPPSIVTSYNPDVGFFSSSCRFFLLGCVSLFHWDT